MSVEDRHLVPQLVRQPHVVGIDERNQVPTRDGNPGIARGAHPAVRVLWMVDVADPVRMGFRVTAGDGRTGVRGAVVDENEFE